MPQSYRCFILSVIAMALVLSAGCGSKEPVPVNPETVRKELVGKKWICEKMFARDVRGDNQLTLEFMADGTIKGNGGCNDFSGTYTLTADSLTFGPLKSTKKSCGAAVGEQEFTYMSFLALIDRMEVDGDDLELYTREEAVPMVFSTSGGGLFW